MRKVINFVSLEEEIYRNNNTNKIQRGTLVEIHISDIHFGVINPKITYDILKEQFLDRIEQLPFDILSIDGDLFEHKFMSNSDVILHASMFINDCVNICRNKNATLILLAGTKSHDDDQLKLFYHYLTDKTVDLRIVEKIQFEYAKGAKILCLPELNNVSEETYEEYLYKSGDYDTAFVHGTIKGAVIEKKNKNTKTFNINDFCMCHGPIIAGHVHPGGRFKQHWYYNGSPIRWEFGEEGEKGFQIVLHNLDTQQYYVHLEPIKSFRYDTINLDAMLVNDPKEIIDYVNNLKSQGIDNIRLEFKKELNDNDIAKLEILKNYYRTQSSIKFDIDRRDKEREKITQQIEEQYEKYKYLLNKNLSEYEILSKYINQQEECTYITADELIQLLNEKI